MLGVARLPRGMMVIGHYLQIEQNEAPVKQRIGIPNSSHRTQEAEEASQKGLKGISACSLTLVEMSEC
ncbi:hypothetical protein RRG08_002150 [Elysia crispata]|uniref:Uncharacterized protein n=1 Tax=Elysia crispata TaxID=231223 RepID=A0AAE0ZAK2_9GAST|nr:hypothetical protein RRG08_002150 [Elysia crispata]